MLDSVEAAKACLNEIQPELCEHYITLWMRDLCAWEQRLEEIREMPSPKMALAHLGLTCTGDSAAATTRQIPNIRKTAPGTAPIPLIPTLNTVPAGPDDKVINASQ